MVKLFNYDHSLRPELVSIWLREHLEVVVLDVAEEFHLASLNDAYVNVATGSEIVVDTSFNGLNDKLHCFVLCHVIAVLGFKDCHGGQRAGASRVVRLRVHVAVAAALDQLGTLHVYTADDQVSADMAAVIERVRAKTTCCHLHSVFAASVESVHFKLALDHLCINFWLIHDLTKESSWLRRLTSNMVTVSCRACTAAEDVGSEVVDLLAVFVTDNGAACCAGISGERDSFLILLDFRFGHLH